MLKKIVVFALLLFATYSNAQKLVYLKNGNVGNSDGNKLSPEMVRQLLATNTAVLDLYNSGRSKKTAGNILLIGGLGLLAGDVVLAAFTPIDSNGNIRTYPTALTYIGLTSFLISIPVKIGFSKKIKNAVEGYNTFHGYTSNENTKIEFIASVNGVGLKYTF